jgi:hypothetical protein
MKNQQTISRLVKRTQTLLKSSLPRDGITSGGQKRPLLTYFRAPDVLKSPLPKADLVTESEGQFVQFRRHQYSGCFGVLVKKTE